MGKDTPEKFIHALLDSTDIRVNGDQPWDITIHHPEFYNRVFSQGALGLGESYVEKWWDSPRIDMLFFHILRANLDSQISPPLSLRLKQLILKFINLQTKQRSRLVAEKHYDLGNTLFSTMLDKNMLYSCGYWKNASNLEEAQLAKLELICQKLKLQAGESLLDIGCGWGGLAKYAAEKYNVKVVGVTISTEQYTYAKELCKELPVTILLSDYRDVNDKFDKIVSVGMFEHVGYLNYPTYFQQVAKMLKDNGLFLLHTIGVNYSIRFVNEWINKYIFPNGMLPSIAQIATATEKIFMVEDWHNFGAYYDNTLMCWYENFIKNWPSIQSHYDEQFYRMWTYYLLSCAGSFRARCNQVWQIVFSKKRNNWGLCCPAITALFSLIIEKILRPDQLYKCSVCFSWS